MNFSVTKLEEIPTFVTAHISEICISFTQLTNLSNQMSNNIGGPIGGSWSEVGQKYASFNERISEIGNQLTTELNGYIAAVKANESSTSVDVSAINSALDNIANELDLLKF